VITIYHGDALEVLKELADESVDEVITSPPYWGLRDYGVEGQIGLELTVQEHIDILIAIFNEIKRVLKPDGICWVNYGDCYASTPNGTKAIDIQNDDRGFVDKPFSTIQGSMKPKDMCLLPERFVIAMQDAGWWVRAKPIWAKSNPMPESAKDRPTTSYEQIYMFTKSEKYKYDHKAVRIKASENTNPGNNSFRNDQYINNEHNVGGWASGKGDHSTLKHNKGVRKSATFKRTNSKRAIPQIGHQQGTHRPDREDKDYQTGTRSLRQWEKLPPVVPPEIWEIPTKPCREAHFATFPPDLVYRCLQAGDISKNGVILDPFGGAGTTALVADRLGFDCILIELNKKYIEIATDRLTKDHGMFGEIKQINLSD